MIINKLFRIWQRMVLMVFRKNIKISPKSKIGYKSYFEGYNTIGKRSVFYGRLGFCSYIGNNCDISANIGKYCSIGHDVKTILSTHPIKGYVSTHPVFYSKRKQNGTTFISVQKFDEYLYADKLNKYGVIIENDVWIGNGVTMIGGITIGNGAVILANSTVTKDVEPYEIVAGIPAKKIKMRFEDSEIEKLLDIKWWNFSEEEIRQNVNLFDDVNKIIDKYRPGLK